MRLVDRILAVAAGLFLIGLVTIIGLDPETLASVLGSIGEANVLLRLALVIVFNILVLITLYITLRSPRTVKEGLAVKAPGAYTDVSIDSARSLLLAAVEAVPDVVSADAKVKAVNGRADVELEVRVAGTDIHVPRKQKEINRALRQVINKQLGLQMRGQPRVHIRLTSDLADEWATQNTKPLPAPASATPVKADVVSKTEDTLVDKAEADKPSEEPESESGTDDSWLSSYASEKDTQSES